jgi:outer membrane protein assembly factor BamB
LWSKPLKTGSRHCIAGDLVFSFDYTRLFACDRYTGEEVWTAARDLKNHHGIKSVDGKLFVSTSTGKLHCFKWEEPYNSAAKANFDSKIKLALN